MTFYLDMHKQMADAELALNFLKDNGTAEDYDTFQQYLGRQFSFNVRDASGSTMLHECVRYDHKELIKCIVALGCNINMKDNNGNTPLMIATMANRTTAMMILLAAGANVLEVNKQKNSVLHMLNDEDTIKREILEALLQALRNQCSSSKEVAQKLMDAKSPLYLAVLLRDVEVAERVLELNPELIAGTSPTNNETALHVAVLLNDLKMVKLLVACGADVEALDTSKISPLYNLYLKHTEHSPDKIEIMKILLSQGASMTTVTRDGDFQVCHALYSGNDEAIRVLIESGLNCNAKSFHGHVLLYLARNTNAGVAEELKRHEDKFDVDACDEGGYTPLFDATLEGNIGMVKFLLENGAKTEILNLSGVTALYAAYEVAEEGFEEKCRRIGEMLLQHDADPQVVVDRGDGQLTTILESAFQRGDLNRIKPVVAHLAMLEKRGTTITKTTRSKINSHRSLKNYFERCQRKLKKKISGRVALFDLLTADYKMMARYLNNKRIRRKIGKNKFRCKLSSYKYYLNTLDKRYVDGGRHKRLRSKAAAFFREIFQNRVDETHVVVDIMIDYLDDRSLQQLSKLSRAVGGN